MAARGKKKTTAGKGRAGARGKKPAPKSRISEIWSIPLFGLALLLLAMGFIQGDSGWAILRSWIFGLVGLGLYPLAISLVYIAYLIAGKRPIGKTVAKAVLGILSCCAIPTVFSVLDLTAKSAWEVVTLLFAQGGESWWSGGVAGAVLGGSLVSLCGRPVANLILALLAVIALMIIFTVTPADLWEFGRSLMGQPEEYPEEDVAPQENWEERHASANARRAQAREEALERRKMQAAQRQKSADQRRRASFDVDLGPDPEPKAQPQEPRPQDMPVHDAIAIYDVDAPLPDGTQEMEPVEIGPGGTFGMNPLSHSEEFSVELDHPQPEQTATMAELLEMRAPTMADMMAAQSGMAQTAAPAQPQAAVPAAQPADNNNPEIATLVQKAVDTAAMNSADTAQQPQQKVNAYRYPPLDLFEENKEVDDSRAAQEMNHNAEVLVNTLDSFGVKTRILDICRGPSVTRYELQPQAGVKISRITSLADDIALNLAASGVRIEAPIPGKPAVGIEIPNRVKTPVGIRGLLESQNFTKSTSPLTMALGRDIAGSAQVADLCRMPHLLIAGSTGSGKSVCVNSILISFLYKSSPEDVKLILIDPKVVELAEYNGIPHLLMPVVTEPKKAAGALGAAVAEMERRYKEFAENNVREIKSYNRKAATTPGMEKMPYIAIVIDELADLMMVSGKEVEDYICRIAQKARAAGMHLIVATQRPSVDVVTGLIKANIPSRIAFAVSSQVDSRTILDGAGAEKLLGMGDMLFMPIGANKPVRVQGAYVKDEEIEACLSFIKESGQAQYDEALISEVERLAAQSGNGKNGGSSAGDDDDDTVTRDPMFEAAVEAVIDAGMASTSLLQRRCKLGYARAARIMDEMEQEGVIGPFEGAKPRKVLLTKQQWAERKLTADNQAPDPSEIPC